MTTADFDMGMAESQRRSMATLFEKSGAFQEWLKSQPHVADSFGAERPSLAFFASAHRADEKAKVCRALRLCAHDPVKRTQVILQYKGWRKVAWFARGQPKAI